LGLYKASLGLSLTLTKDDIMLLVNRAWNKSFARRELTAKAVAMRGWNPLNRGILTHPEVVRTKVEPTDASNATQQEAVVDGSTASTESSFLPQVNITEGFAGTVVDRLVQHRLRNDGRERRSQMLQAGTRIEHEMQNAKRLTSGIMVANGQFCVNKVRDIINKRDMDHHEKEMARARKAWHELKKQVAAIKKIWFEKGDNIKTWNAKECKIFLQYKKVEGDSAMPSKIDDLSVHCELIAHH